LNRNSVGWVILVVSVLVVGYFGYSLQHDLVAGALGLATAFAGGMIGLGLVGIWQGIDRLDDPKRGLIVALVIFSVFMAAAFVAGLSMSAGGDGVASFSFYIMDANGKLVKAMPKSAFGLFSLWTGATELYDQFSICYDCTAHVKDAPVKPQYLSFMQKVYVRDSSSGKWVSATGAESTSMIPNRYTTASWLEVVQYHTSGWVSAGTNEWKIDVGKDAKLVATTITKGDSVWNVGTTFKFIVGLIAQTNVAGTNIESSEIMSPYFEVEKRGDPLSATIWLDNVNWGVSGEELPSGGQI